MVVKGLLAMKAPPLLILIVLMTLWADNLPHRVDFGLQLALFHVLVLFHHLMETQSEPFFIEEKLFIYGLGPTTQKRWHAIPETT